MTETPAAEIHQFIALADRRLVSLRHVEILDPSGEVMTVMIGGERSEVASHDAQWIAAEVVREQSATHAVCSPVFVVQMRSPNYFAPGRTVSAEGSPKQERQPDECRSKFSRVR
jgi:hypothetical protein